LELHKVLLLAKKWLLLIALAALVGGAAGLVVSILQPKVYESDTELYFSSPNHTDYNSTLGDQLAAKAFASLPQSNSVLTATLQAVGDKSLSLTQFASMVTITNNLNSQYVTLGVRDNDPKRATRLARELARQSILRFEAGATDSGQTRQFVQQELTNLTNEIKSLEQQIAAAPQGTSSGQLSANLNAVRTLYNQLLSSYNLMSDTQITIVQDAQVPQSPFGQNKTFAIAIGAMVGLIAIFSVIILLEQTDDVLRTAEKVSRATGLPILIAVAYSPILARRIPHANVHDEAIEDRDTAMVEPAAAEQITHLNGYGEASENGDTLKIRVLKHSYGEASENGDTIRIDKAKLVAARAAYARLQAEQAEDTVREAVVDMEIPDTPSPVENHKVTEHTDKPLPAIARQASVDRADSRIWDKALIGYQLPEEFLTLGVLLSGDNAQPTSNGNSIGSLLITSSEKGDGKTQIALQVAYGLASVGVEVVLLDANLRNPEIHKMFDLPNEGGLSSLLTGHAKVDPTLVSGVLRETHDPHLRILPSGPTIVSPSALLSSPRMSDILHVLSEKALIVIDSPAVLTASDSVILAKRCDSVLMVVDTRHTKTTKLNRALEMLTRVNASIIGIVLNRTRDKE
jgi:capsular exopolysaccharide synthesis family protein